MSFDAIVCRHFIWTLREPEIALRSWRALLRPGGCIIAIDGHWFREDQPGAASAGEAGFFDRYYTRETRSAVPLMAAVNPDPVVAAFELAGFTNIAVSYLTSVHALAEHPPSQEPWYVVMARP